MPIFNKTHVTDLTPVITAGAYSAGDVIGGLLTLDMSGAAGGGGAIRRMLIIDADNEKAAGTLYLFSAAPTVIADNGAFTPSAADLKKLIGVVNVTAADYATVNNLAYALIKDLSVEYICPTGNLFAYFVCSGTPTYTTPADLTLRVIAWQD